MNDWPDVTRLTPLMGGIWVHVHVITVQFFSTATTCWWYWWLVWLRCFLCQFVQVKQTTSLACICTCIELVLLLGHWMEVKWPGECTLMWVMVVLNNVHMHSVTVSRPSMVHLKCLRPFLAVSECSQSENPASYSEWKLCASNMFFQSVSWTITAWVVKYVSCMKIYPWF